jgi:hypothetical protein
LVLHKPEKCNVRVTVLTVNEDQGTHNVIDWGSKAGIDIQVFLMEPHQIGRRSIGRNWASLLTKANFVWFSDCDQVYRDGVLDKLVELTWPEEAVMIFPQHIHISTKRTGNKILRAVGALPHQIDIDLSQFYVRKYFRAIGGVQIVKGDFAREHGYLNGYPRWEKPTDGTFQRCHCDIAYRKACLKHGSIVPVDLPGMYRIQHSIKGKNKGKPDD